MTSTGIPDKLEADRRALAAAKRDGARWYVLWKNGEYNLCHADSVCDAPLEGWSVLYPVDPED